MGDLNAVALVGRVSQQPKARPAGQSGVKVCDVTVANNTFGKNGVKTTSFIRCTAWDTQAEWAEKNLRVGDTVSVSGRIVEDNYETTKGDPETKTSGRLKIDRCDIQMTRKGPKHETAEVPPQEGTQTETTASPE